MRILATIVLVLASTLLGGCKTLTRSRASLESSTQTNNAALAEESRALTTGALDSLGRVPATNTPPPVDLARRLLTRDQAIEGLPGRRIDVDAILAGQTQALRDLSARLDGIDKLISERQRLATELEKTRNRLADLGEKYEAERAKSIWRRIFTWFGFTGSIAALLALVIFFPPALIVITRIVGFVVGRIPQLASVFGVVTTKAFAGVVTAVEKAREVIRADHGPAAEEKVLTAMSRAMDRPHKDAVKVVKASQA